MMTLNRRSALAKSLQLIAAAVFVAILAGCETLPPATPARALETERAPEPGRDAAPDEEVPPSTQLQPDFPERPNLVPPNPTGLPDAEAGDDYPGLTPIDVPADVPVVAPGDDTGIDVGVVAECAFDEECDDGNPCTDDFCTPNGACLSYAFGCPGGGVCDPATGECPVTDCATDVDCDDGNACTDDLCSPSGVCFNSFISCDDGDECTADSCDAQAGCVNTPGECDAEEPDPLPQPETTLIRMINDTPFVVLEWEFTGGVNGADFGPLAEPGESIELTKQDLAGGTASQTRFSVTVATRTLSRTGPRLTPFYTFEGSLDVSMSSVNELRLSSTAILGGADASGRRWTGSYSGLDRRNHTVTLQVFRSGAWTLTHDGQRLDEGRLESEFANDNETINVALCRTCGIKEVFYPYDRIEHTIRLASPILGGPAFQQTVTLMAE